MVSGKLSALILAGCFLLTGILVPIAAHLPRWIEFELVLIAWWLVWIASLSAFLYRGRKVRDDMPPASRLHGDYSWADIGGCVGVESAGCGEVLGGIVIAIFLIIALFLFVEFALPGVAFMTYLVIRGMLATVVNSRRGCA